MTAGSMSPPGKCLLYIYVSLEIVGALDEWRVGWPSKIFNPPVQILKAGWFLSAFLNLVLSPVVSVCPVVSMLLVCFAHDFPCTNVHMCLIHCSF